MTRPTGAAARTARPRLSTNLSKAKRPGEGAANPPEARTHDNRPVLILERLGTVAAAWGPTVARLLLGLVLLNVMLYLRWTPVAHSEVNGFQAQTSPRFDQSKATAWRGWGRPVWGVAGTRRFPVERDLRFSGSRGAAARRRKP